MGHVKSTLYSFDVEVTELEGYTGWEVLAVVRYRGDSEELIYGPAMCRSRHQVESALRQSATAFAAFILDDTRSVLI
jgi:hypothetical protein